GVLLQPLPYPASDRIVQLFQIDKDGKRMSVSQPNFRDWKSDTRSFGAMALSNSGSGPVTVNGLSEPVRARAAVVSRDFFRVFGLAPERGRTFVDDELRTGGSPAVVVSDAFWRRHLDASPQAIGRVLRVNNTLYTVVGIMPPEMNYPADNELWMPVEIEPPSNARTSHGWRVVARLKDGVTFAQAKQDLSAVSRRLKQQYGDETWMSDGDMVALHEQLVGKVRTTLFVLFGASAFLLLIACANVVNLLVARMTIRRSEIGLRVALGATRARLAQQFLTETGVLALLGGLLGVGLAAAGIRILVAMQTTSLPRANEIHLSWPVLVF